MKYLAYIRGLNPRTRFSLMLILIYVLSVPVISGISYVILKDNAIDYAYRTGRLFLSTFEATRHYVGYELRPRLYDELPGRFVLEGMSRSYVAGKIAHDVLKKYPGYRYKHASFDPKNPLNEADPFEEEIIREFQTSSLHEWKGMRTVNGNEYYVIAIPGNPVRKDCLLCHGDPDQAPREVIELYGREAGFGRKIGEIIDGLFAYIPIKIPLDNARDNVLLFITLYTVFFTLVFFVIDRRFRWFYEKIHSANVEIEGFNKEILDLNKILETLVAERTMTMLGMRVADSIRNPVTVIGGFCYRLLKKEMDRDSEEKIALMLKECEKVEQIITDFDAMVEKKRFLFHQEDLNEIVISTLNPLVKAMSIGGIHLKLELSEKPLPIKANKQLLKVAFAHMLRNAIDAVSPGGKITVQTGFAEENVFLVIGDTGKGIPEQYLAEIFNPLFGTKDRIGMGLPLVKQVINEHFGEITVVSNSPAGTTFKITFPELWIKK